MTAQTPTLMTCDDVRDLLGAYALGILAPDEHEAVDRHLDRCPDCRYELAQLDGVVDALGTAPLPAPPSPALRARLLQNIQPIPVPYPTPTPLTPLPATDTQRSTVIALPRWMVWSAAAAAVLLIAGVAALAVLLAGERDDRESAQSASAQLAAYLSAGGQVTKLREATTDGHYYGHGTLVTAPKMSPLVIVAGCSPTSDDRIYRVWAARGDDRTRVGELKVSGSGEGWIEVNLDDSLESFDSIGITMITGEDQRQDVLVAQVNQSTPS
jgi:anti-sigma-K factor RskA